MTPLMILIADSTGIFRYFAVFVYQFGDRFTNMLVRTNAVLMCIIGIADISYDNWIKYLTPLMVKFRIIGFIVLIIADWIGYN